MSSASPKPLGFILLASVVSLASVGCEQHRTAHSTAQRNTRQALPLLRDYLLTFDPPTNDKPGHAFYLLAGQIGHLEKWLTGKRREDPALFHHWSGFFSVLVDEEPSGQIRLLDLWGRSLVYQCPAEQPKYVFRLYSVGSNGIDENGGGDDIDVSPLYSMISHRFEDPGFDGDIYRKYRGQFTKIKSSNRSLIRHPGWLPRGLATTKADLGSERR